METVEQYYSEQGTLVPVRGVVGNNKIVLLINGMRVNPPGGEELMIRDDVSVRYRRADRGRLWAGLHPVRAGRHQRGHQHQDPPARRHAPWRRWGPTATTTAGRASRPVAEAGGAGRRRRWQLTAFAAVRGSDLSNLRKAYPVWYRNYDAVAGAHGIYRRSEARGHRVQPVRADRVPSSASLQAWFRDSQPQFGRGQRRRRHDAGAVLRGGVHVARSFAGGRGATRAATGAIACRCSRSWRSTATRWIPTPGTCSPMTRVGWSSGTSRPGWEPGSTVEEKLDWSLGENTSFMAGVMVGNYDIVPKTTVRGRRRSRTEGSWPRPAP